MKFKNYCKLAGYLCVLMALFHYIREDEAAARFDLLFGMSWQIWGEICKLTDRK
jgi:hypothetical protein